MTVEITPPLLIETRIQQEKQRDSEGKTRLVLPQFTDNCPDRDRTQPAPDKCKDLPVHRNLRNQPRSNLIEQSPHWAVCGEILSHCTRTQLITNPRHGQVIPIE